MKRKIIGTVLALAVLIVLTVMVMGFVSEKSTQSGRSIVYDAVHRAAMTCFATEGFYPDQIDYLKAHYGLVYDEDMYIVRYDCWAKNQLPDISVWERR